MMMDNWKPSTNGSGIPMAKSAFGDDHRAEDGQGEGRGPG
jgi:hypothetical protein